MNGDCYSERTHLKLNTQSIHDCDMDQSMQLFERNSRDDYVSNIEQSAEEVENTASDVIGTNNVLSSSSEDELISELREGYVILPSTDEGSLVSLGASCATESIDEKTLRETEFGSIHSSNGSFVMPKLAFLPGSSISGKILIMGRLTNEFYQHSIPNDSKNLFDTGNFCLTRKINEYMGVMIVFDSIEEFLSLLNRVATYKTPIVPVHPLELEVQVKNSLKQHIREKSISLLYPPVVMSDPNEVKSLLIYLSKMSEQMDDEMGPRETYEMAGTSISPKNVNETQGRLDLLQSLLGGLGLTADKHPTGKNKTVKIAVYGICLGVGIGACYFIFRYPPFNFLCKKLLNISKNISPSSTAIRGTQMAAFQGASKKFDDGGMFRIACDRVMALTRRLFVKYCDLFDIKRNSLTDHIGDVDEPLKWIMLSNFLY